MNLLTFPHKPLSRCNLEELAAQQVINERRRQQSGGIAFARKEEQDGKDAARRSILSLLTLDQKPGKRLSILTMPGLCWTFEAKLLWQRDPYWQKREKVKHLRFTCVESDRFIYYAAAMKMPGIKQCGIQSLVRPGYAERAVGQKVIDRYIFANVDDLMQDRRESFDVAWLDYTGPLSVDRMKIIERFWREQVRDTLVVTALKARWTKATSSVIAQHGSCLDWMRARLLGCILHEIEYQDGASPMVQFAIAKPRP